MSTVIRQILPAQAVLAALSYALGLGVADYLGVHLRTNGIWLGLAWILLMLVASMLLVIVFRPLHDLSPESESPQVRLLLRNRLLAVSATALLSTAILSLLMLRAGLLSPPVIVLQLLATGLALALAVPPLRLIHSGFGELVLSVLLLSMPASLAFGLQTAEFHRLVGFITLPLILLALAWQLAASFPSFASDQKHRRQTVLVRLGWERTIPLHRLALLAGYGLLAAAPLFGASLALVWPGFMSLPFAVLQAVLLRTVAAGGRPNWPLLNATSLAAVGLATYFLALSFWSR
jgi:1,4-dihydroxy-2-naphthoate octaprenyltransferase